MIRSGELTNRLEWYSSGIGSPPAWQLKGKIWAKVVEPKSAGREGQSSIMASGSTFITVRPRPDMQAGHLFRNQHAWWLIEDVAMLPGEYQISARKLSGYEAVYTPKDGVAYPVTAWLSNENALVGAKNELLYQIDLIKPELAWPFARIGDQIMLLGRTYKIKGISEGSDNGTTIRVMVN